jgi:hypothetical protein
VEEETIKNGNTYVRKFILWTEGEPTRFRKAVLLTILITWVISTIGIVMIFAWGKPDGATNVLYGTICAALAAAYGFYTSTSASTDNPITNVLSNIEKTVTK